MIIESLKLENFRNISRAELHFDSDAVFFEGGNGQGKTSLLEAVFYVANLRSFRTLKINELKKLCLLFMVEWEKQKPVGIPLQSKAVI